MHLVKAYAESPAPLAALAYHATSSHDLFDAKSKYFLQMQAHQRQKAPELRVVTIIKLRLTSLPHQDYQNF